ncbi:MAG: acyltransferase [Bacteroidales bacterium]|nr:acyltransferase [Bacteroidales bacterium]
MIKELNLLRIVFMLMVFLNHSAFLADGGYLGVACFFVLGGYCSALGYYDKVKAESFNYRQYALSKAIKFYPLHWLCAIVWLAIAVASSQPLGSVTQILANAALLQSWIPDAGFYFSLNGISWYLADTLFFALIFPFVIRFIVDKSLSRNVAFVSFVILGYTAACLLTPKSEQHAILYINPAIRFVDFLLGVYLAKGFMTIRPRIMKSSGKMTLFYIIAALSIAALIVERGIAAEYVQFAWIFWPLISVLLLSASIASACRPKEYKVIDFLSSAGSYCFVFYMIHLMTIQVCNSIAHKLQFEYHFTVMLITLTICCVLTFFCQKWFVAPVTKALNKQLKGI